MLNIIENAKVEELIKAAQTLNDDEISEIIESCKKYEMEVMKMGFELEEDDEFKEIADEVISMYIDVISGLDAELNMRKLDRIWA